MPDTTDESQLVWKEARARNATRNSRQTTKRRIDNRAKERSEAAEQTEKAASGRRTKADKRGIAERLAKVAELITKGYRNFEIAKVVGVSEGQIRYDRAKIEAEWREEYLKPISVAKDAQLARLDLIETQLWAAWAKSLEPEKTEVADHTKGKKNQVRVTIKYQYGNPQFLSLLLGVIDRRTRLLGLDAPIKIDFEPEIRRYARERGLDEEKAVAAAQRILNEAKSRGK